MNKLSTKIIALLVLFNVLVTCTAVIVWLLVIEPKIRSDEQTKADLLITPYTRILEEAIDKGDRRNLEQTMNHLLLLSSTNDNSPLILRLTLTTDNGETIEKSNVINNKNIKVSEFSTETPLFSPTRFSLLGTIKLDFNDQGYRDISVFSKNLLIWFIVFVLLLTVFVHLFISSLIKPLELLAKHVQKIDNSQFVALPGAPQKATQEINGIWRAVSDLLGRLSERELELNEEHAAKERALVKQIEAESASNAKNKFLANVSHELRTPLNAIIGYTELLREEAIEINHGEFIYDLIKIETAGKHLLNLINNLLDFSKIESGDIQFHIQKFLFSDTLNSIVEMLNPVISANSNKLVIDIKEKGVEINSDLTKVNQILINIISNAAKYTDNGNISITVTRRAFNLVEGVLIEVTDTGPGISQVEIDKLFTPFQSLDNNTSRRQSGMGLGLTIAKEFCELLGGFIRVSSSPASGTTFHIALPLDINHPLTDDSQDTHNFRSDSPNSGDKADSKAISAIERKPYCSVLGCFIKSKNEKLVEKLLLNTDCRYMSTNNDTKALERFFILKPDIVITDNLTLKNNIQETKSQTEYHKMVKNLLLFICNEATNVTHSNPDNITTIPEIISESDLQSIFQNAISSRRSQRILVLDSDQDSWNLFNDAFTRKGWKAVNATSEADANKLISETIFDAVVISEHHLNDPVMDLIARLRNDKQHFGIPIVILMENTETANANMLAKYKPDYFYKGITTIETLTTQLEDQFIL